MKHLGNLHQLFAKNFVEHPLIETLEVGNINLPTGKLVACDPLITSEMPSFQIEFPIGEFPILVHKERDSNCVAYVEIVFIPSTVVRWELAICKGQHMHDLKEGEIYGYPVESGMGCFMDVETQECLNRLEKRLFHRKGEEFMGIYEEFFHEHFFQQQGAINQYAFLTPQEDHAGNIFAFETGYGQGFYASYIGFDSNELPVKIVSEFIEIIS